MLGVCAAATLLLGVVPHNVLLIGDAVNLLELVRIAAGSLAIVP